MAFEAKIVQEPRVKRLTRTRRPAGHLELVEGPATNPKKTVSSNRWVGTREFAKIVGKVQGHILRTVDGNQHKYILFDGAVTVRTRQTSFGQRWKAEFNRADALELKRRLDEQKRDFVNGGEVAMTVSRSPAWVSQIFHEKGTRRKDRDVLKIEIGDKTIGIPLYYLGERKDTRKLRLMRRDHLELFATWVRERGDMRTWNKAEKSEIPDGYITTTVAGRLLGFEKQPDVHIRLRIDSNVIKNWQRLRDGRVVVLESEIDALREIKERMIKTTTKLLPFCVKKLGMSDGQVWRVVREDITGKQIFVIKELGGFDATVPISKDFDGELAILHADAKELMRIHREKEAGLISKEDAAQMLGVSPETIRRYTNPKTETVGLILEDRNIFTIHVVLDRNEYRFVKKDVQAARKANDTAKHAFVGVVDIAEMVDLDKRTIRQILADNDYTFETKDKHNKIVSISIQHGKEGKLLVPKRYARILADLIMKGEYIPVGFTARLYGKPSESENPVRIEPFFTKFPEMREAVIINPANGRSLLPLFIDANVALPLMGENGNLLAAAEDRILVEMYARLFCWPNLDAVEFAETFLKVVRKWSAGQLNETQIAALHTLRQFTNWIGFGNAGDKARELLVKLEKKPFATIMETEMPETTRYYDFALTKLVDPIPPRHFWPE